MSDTPFFNRFLPLFFLLFAQLALYNGVMAQTNVVKGRVINDFTKEVVPFASIFWKRSGQGITTDSAGHFELKKSPYKLDTIIVSYVGFERVYKPFSQQKDTVSELLIYLHEAKLNDGVIVKSKFSKGLRWWKKVVDNKKKNNPYQFDNYHYELYNKLELDLTNVNKSLFENKKLLRPFGFILNNIDSTSDAKPFLPVFVTEALSDYYYSSNPYKVREEIKAVQTNGIKNETVLQFMGGVTQRINTYNDYISLFGKEFISPLSALGDKYYHYKGADTQTVNKQKYFHLFFTPLQEGSNTFSGDCWIHSTTWAIQKINLTASASANINFVNRLSVVQEFAQTNDSVWVFAKDKMIADLSPFKKEKISFIGRKTVTYHNVVLNQTATIKVLEKNSQKEEIVVLEDAKKQTNDYWNNVRHEPLSANELKVYHMIDTLKQMPLFKTYSNNVEFIVDGHKKFGKIEIGPWYKWISGNQLEKVRMRFDIGTTPQFSEQLRLNCYLAYGFKDARWKGKAAFHYKFDKQESWSIFGSYTHDLDNGRVRYNEDADVTVDNMFSQLIRRSGIKQKFLGVAEIKTGITKQWRNNVAATATFSNTNYEPFAPLPQKDIFTYRENGNITNTEVALKFRFAPGEKTIATHRKSIRLKTKLPIIEAKYAVGIPDVLKSEYTYQRANIMASQTFRLPRWGQIDYLAYAGKTFGNRIPFMLLEVHPGNEIYYYSKQSFNLMSRFEYVSDTYAGFNIEHNFEKKLLNLLPFMRKTKLRQFWNVKTVIGSLSQSNRSFNRLEFGTYRMKTLRNTTYTEVGTGIDNIFKFFRVDLVWRFAPTFTPPTGSTNILKDDPQHLGIFGSFKLQF